MYMHGLASHHFTDGTTNPNEFGPTWLLSIPTSTFPSFVPVDDSAILDCQFSDFYHTPPQGFEKILFEQQIF